MLAISTVKRGHCLKFIPLNWTPPILYFTFHIWSASSSWADFLLHFKKLPENADFLPLNLTTTRAKKGEPTEMHNSKIPWTQANKTQLRINAIWDNCQADTILQVAYLKTMNNQYPIVLPFCKSDMIELRTCSCFQNVRIMVPCQSIK